ncbi:retrotransposon gag domain, retroviral aspartyl protease [Tanacetum coccineum]
MVNTRSTNSNTPQNQSNDQPNNPSNEIILQQLAQLSSQMAAMDAAQSKDKCSTHNEFQASSKPPWADETNFDGDAPWLMSLPFIWMVDGDALDLFAWINNDRTLLYWEDLVKVLQEHYGPAEFQNPDDHLCGIRQTGTVQEYRQEFAKRSSRVKNWPEHCLLGVFLNGLRDDLKADVRIHKPRSVYKARSLALEFEQKVGHSRGAPKSTSWFNSAKTNTQSHVMSNPQSSNTVTTLKNNTPNESFQRNQTRPWDVEKQNRIARGLCLRCNEKFAPGHRCKIATLTLIEHEDADPGEEEVVDMIITM